MCVHVWTFCLEPQSTLGSRFQFHLFTIYIFYRVLINLPLNNYNKLPVHAPCCLKQTSGWDLPGTRWPSCDSSQTALKTIYVNWESYNHTIVLFLPCERGTILLNHDTVEAAKPARAMFAMPWPRAPALHHSLAKPACYWLNTASWNQLTV